MDPPEPADRRARAGLAKMEERDDKETIEVAFHPPDKSKRTDLHRPPYAVAPEPQADEAARPASTQIAIPDLHTVTVPEVLQALDEALDRTRARPDAIAQARNWLRTATAALNSEGPRDDGEYRNAISALGEAAEQALGLAGR